MADSTSARTALASAHDGPLLGGELAHLLQNGGQFSLFAQVLDPEGLQLSGVPGGADGCQRAGANGFQLFLHTSDSFFELGAWRSEIGTGAAAVRLYWDHPALPDTKTPIFYLISPIFVITKNASRPIPGTKGESFRGTTRIRAKSGAHSWPR